MNRSTDPTVDALATPWGSRRLPLPWREPVDFGPMAALDSPALPGQRPGSAVLLPLQPGPAGQPAVPMAE